MEGETMKKVLSIFLAVVILISGVVFASAKGNDRLQFDENGQFKIIMKYKGTGFDPNNIHNPNMEDYFNKFKVGGLGVPIMKRFMNKIEYVHNNSEDNYLTLIKSLQS